MAAGPEEAWPYIIRGCRQEVDALMAQEDTEMTQHGKDQPAT